MTLDLDIAVSPDKTNLRRFISTLNQLKFIPRAPVPAETILNREFIDILIREKNALVFTFWCPGEPYKQIDMFLTRENSFDDLVSDARILTVCGRNLLGGIPAKAHRDEETGRTNPRQGFERYPGVASH